MVLRPATVGPIPEVHHGLPISGSGGQALSDFDESLATRCFCAHVTLDRIRAMTTSDPSAKFDLSEPQNRRRKAE